MKRRAWGNFILALILALGLVIIPCSRMALADDNDQGKYKLEISPVSKRITLDPGEQRKDSVRIKNTGSDTALVSVYAEVYYVPNEYQEQTGGLKSSYTQIADWISFKGSDGNYHKGINFAMEPEQSRELRFAINVPEEALGGGQYAIIYAEFSPVEKESEESAIKMRSRVGMSIFAYINGGEVVRGAEITNIRTVTFALGDKISVFSDIKNSGNVDFQASVDAKVETVFGSELYHDIAVESILPESTQVVGLKWEETPTIGLFSLNYKISALDQFVEDTRLILVMPLGVLGLLIFFISLALIVLIHSKRKQYWQKHRSEVLGNR